MRCPNCGNEDFRTQNIRHFTFQCPVCGRRTNTTTGIQTWKIKLVLIILVLAVLAGLGIWSVLSDPTLLNRTAGLF